MSDPNFIHPVIGYSVVSAVDKVVDWMRVRGHVNSPDDPSIEEHLREGVTHYMVMLAHAVQRVVINECQSLAEKAIESELEKTLNSASIEVATDAEASRVIASRRG